MELDRLLVWMEPYIDRSFVPQPFDLAVATDVLGPAAGRSLETHVRLLEQWNGFYALDRLLHVFGACEFPPNHSLRAWNASDGWRASWGRLTEGLTFFAEDAFGDQFAYRGGKIVRLRTLAGGIEVLHASLTEWIEAVLLEPEYVLNAKLYRACIAQLGPLPHGGHIVPTNQISTGEPLDPQHVAVTPARDSMEVKAVMAARVVRKSSTSIRIPKI
jgi:hypothetical protein